jgi:hypothetical protein
MKLEIELDLNKIDYDAINKQIAEKVAALDIKNMYDVEARIDNKISSLVKDEVDYSYNQYLNKYWSSPTDEGKKLIENMTKAEIENRTKKIMEEVFTNDYNEDTLREVMLKMIPDVFAYTLFEKLDTALCRTSSSYYNSIHNLVRGEIDAKINRMRY